MEEFCKNCDGRKCMSCVLRYHHDACEDDCPDCCSEVLFEIDDYPTQNRGSTPYH